MSEALTTSPAAFDGPARGHFADSSFTALELSAIHWLEGFYQLEHLLATRAWVMALTSGTARPELRFAALVHDAERFFPGGPPSAPGTSFDDPDYLFQHSVRSGDIVGQWLADHPERALADSVSATDVRALILRHEIGGGHEADILQAADSLSFLETLDWLTVDWVSRGVYTVERAQEKLRWSVERIRPPEALRVALPLYDSAVSLLHSCAPPATKLAERRRRAGDSAWLIGHSCENALTSPC